MYAVDGSNYRQIPIGLVVPKDKEDVIAAVGACRKFDAPILARGPFWSTSRSVWKASMAPLSK
jgi:FAD/FMN-containing dehydrogenase